MDKILPNKCSGTRAVFDDGVAYRIISFLASHPSMIDASEWQRIELEGKTFIIDKASAGLMANHQCELLTVDNDKSDEPTIHAVKITNLLTEALTDESEKK